MATLWLSFRKQVDFKTDVEIGGHLAQYRAQLEIYMRGIAQSTGVGARRPAVGLKRFRRARHAGREGVRGGADAWLWGGGG